MDTSAFVKTIVEEPESGALLSVLARDGRRRASSALLRAEAVRAVRDQGPETLADARSALRKVDLIAVTDALLELAGTLEPRILRTLDAIHLATALSLADDLDAIITYDEGMAEGARLLGIAVTSPR